METAVAFEYCHPRALLETQPRSGATLFTLSDRHLTWHFYFDQGDLVYGSNSADPFERLERHLRSLADQLPALSRTVRDEMRRRFAGMLQQPAAVCADYDAIAWSVGELYVDAISAGTLCHHITAEVLEAYLQLPEAHYRIHHQPLATPLPVFCKFPPETLFAEAEERLQAWKNLVPQVRSPYQRPYLVSKSLARKRLKENRVQQLRKLLVGFNFRQLGMITGQDDLRFAQRLHPLIAGGVIALRPPVEPFIYLPYPLGSESEGSLGEESQGEESTGEPSAFQATLPEPTALHMGLIAPGDSPEDTLGIGDRSGTPAWTIACVDPDDTLAKVIRPLVEDAAMAIVQIEDPTQALVDFTNRPPDLVFVQTAMAGIDGYELCTLMHKSPLLQNTPIILVSPKRGLFDGARAKLAGATDALASPYEAKELVNLIFRYLGQESAR